MSAPDHGVPANVAYAHHDNNRNVPDEWSMELSKYTLFPNKKETDEGEGFDPRGSRQMDMQACPLGSLLRGNKFPLTCFPRNLKKVTP